MNKYRYLIKNIGLLTISNFGTKILSFILIPIYTSILTTAEYGTYDVYSTTVSLMIPILTFNIVEAVMRFSLDQTKSKKDIFSIGLKRIVLSTGIITLLIIINSSVGIIEIFTIYPMYFVVLFAFSLLYDLFIQFARGLEQIADVAAAGAINAIVMLGLNVYFLAFLNIGLDGYFLANILACILPCFYLFFRLKAWNYITNNTDSELKSEMYSFSKPLVFNTLAWWINNVSDRYIVTWICGVAANGVYSVAYKIPSVLNVFQSIFSQAWTISAVKEFDENSGEFYSKIYRMYNCAMVIVCSLLITADKIMAKILFAKDFFLAWKYAPFLMISVVFGALSGLLGGIFSAAKMSKVYATTTFVGASVNTVLNVGLVFLWGPIGAAVATMISYMLVWGARFIEASKIVRLTINIKRDCLSYVILIVQSILFILIQGHVVYIAELVLLIMILVLHYSDIKMVLVSLKKH